MPQPYDKHNFRAGSRPENGATGYAVAWKKGNTWKATNPTWAGARKPTTQNAQRLEGPSE